MEDKTKIGIGIIALITIIIGGISYNVFETGNELVCRTGNGWTIINELQSNDGSIFYESQCQYTTKEWVNAYCSGFRSTPSYDRYGCNEVLLDKKIINKELSIKANSKTEVCSPKGCTPSQVFN